MELTPEQETAFRDLCREIKPGEYGRVVVSFIGEPSNLVQITGEKNYRFHKGAAAPATGKPVDSKGSGRCQPVTAASEPRTMPGYALPKRKRHGITNSFRGLMAAVINRALADLERNGSAIKASPAVKDEAMAWINSPDCEAFCQALDMDYAAIREKAAALYRRFLEREEGREKARGRPRRVRGLAS